MTTMQTSGTGVDNIGTTQNRADHPGATIAASRPDLLNKVSAAQQRVLEYLLEGLTEPQIAERIGRSRHTVHDHTKAIYSALNVNNRVQLVLLFSAAPGVAQAAQRASVQPPISDVVYPQQARPLAQPLSSVA
ncbi:MAG: helix-turn-helix transcriptional regulator [Phycisphaeraceae bacterium]|nr:helix-turn-helix transcriptional regulator [Phycisphaeraceae bacterium]MBX3409036.1 helix-turn-helix transcriptional regulator [Phycisphaeraceae bacterium]